MAIIFARLDPVHLTARSGAARLIAYTGRTIIADRGLLHDYRHLAADLAHQEVMLPADYPAEFDAPRSSQPRLTMLSCRKFARGLRIGIVCHRWG